MNQQVTTGSFTIHEQVTTKDNWPAVIRELNPKLQVGTKCTKGLEYENGINSIADVAFVSLNSYYTLPSLWPAFCPGICLCTTLNATENQRPPAQCGRPASAEWSNKAPPPAGRPGTHRERAVIVHRLVIVVFVPPTCLVEL